MTKGAEKMKLNIGIIQAWSEKIRRP